MFVILSLAAMRAKQEVDIQFLIVPVLMAVFGYIIMKLLVFDLVDEVLDAGGTLIVKNNKQEDRVLLSNIINVNHSTFTNPPRITITLRQPCRFGKEIAFSPVVSFSLLNFSLLWKSPIANELIERIDAVRRG